MNQLKKRFEYIFATENRYPGAPSVQPFEIIDKKPFSLLGKTIIPISVMHGNLPILGYRIENMAYITDAKTIDFQELEKLRGIDILILNALRKTVHPTHMNLDQALKTVNYVRPKKTYLTHISHDMGFHKEVQQELPEHIFLAYDNLQIEF